MNDENLSDLHRAFLQAIEAEPENESHRQVYADYLDEQGEYEEAERQRRILPAVAWLKAFARKYQFAYSGYWPNGERDFDEEEDPEVYGEETLDNTDWPLGHLIHFLDRHQPGADHFLHYDIPDYWTYNGEPARDDQIPENEKWKRNGKAKLQNFDAYSDELWENYEIVTGRKAPTGAYRKEMPPFRCAC